SSRRARSRSPAGHGLVGLRERARRLDGTVTVGRPPTGPGFLLRLTLPPQP
ncbi:two-component sensor histidine kinase, partial [Micromonospora globispora]